MENWEEIISLCKKRNRQGQKQLFSLLWPYLNGVGKRYVYNQHDIQDILQEVFISIFKSINQYDASKAHFKTWATRIMINACIKHNQKTIKQKNNLEIKDWDVVINPVVFEKLNFDELQDLLKKMPSSYYAIFNLYVIDGYSHNEISTLLKIEATLSRQRLARAKKWIKENFKEDDIISILEK